MVIRLIRKLGIGLTFLIFFFKILFLTLKSRFIADCKAEMNDSGRSSISSEQKVLVDRFKLNIRYNVTIESAVDSSYAYLSVIEQKSEYENLQESCNSLEFLILPVV